MNVICTICARKGSKGIKNKALRKINNIPLIAYTIKQALSSRLFRKVIVSTDSKEIQKVALKYGASSWFLRPKKYANDYCSKLEAVKHAFNESENYLRKKIDICVDLDVTSPLRKINDIKIALKKFKKSNSEVLFSVCEAKKNPYFNMVELEKGYINLVKKEKKNQKNFFYNIVRRQDTPKVFEMNASIYIYSRNFLKKGRNIFSKKTSYYLMPRERSIDIDDIFDLNIVKRFLK